MFQTQHGRGRRGSGGRRLRELTRAVVDTMEILEEVRSKHSGVGGMSKAFVQVVKLGLQTCMAEPEEDRIGTTGRDGGNGSAPMSNPNTQAPAAGAIVEKPLPPGVASVLWELECCAAQARVTLMNLSEGRPNHFGVFRACVYVEEMRILETKVLELVELASNPREERNASLGETVAAGIRNCVARLWWARRAGENAESMSWEDFVEFFQADFGAQLPTTLDTLCKHIATRGYCAGPRLLPPPPCPPLGDPSHRPSATAAATVAGIGARKRGVGIDRGREGREATWEREAWTGDVEVVAPGKTPRTLPATPTGYGEVTGGKIAKWELQGGLGAAYATRATPTVPAKPAPQARPATDRSCPPPPPPSGQLLEEQAPHDATAWAATSPADSWGTSILDGSAADVARGFSAASRCNGQQARECSASATAGAGVAATGGGACSASAAPDLGARWAATAAAINAHTELLVATLGSVSLKREAKAGGQGVMRAVAEASAANASAVVGNSGGSGKVAAVMRSKRKADAEWTGAELEIDGDGVCAVKEGATEKASNPLTVEEDEAREEQQNEHKKDEGNVDQIPFDSAVGQIEELLSSLAATSTATSATAGAVASASSSTGGIVERRTDDLSSRVSRVPAIWPGAANARNENAVGVSPALMAPQNSATTDNSTAACAAVIDWNNNRNDGGSKWRVPAGKYEELTSKFGGLYEAFQGVTDPRRVVYSMGVVDDGPHHEGGGEGEDGDDAGPVVVEGLLGLSVQQVCCGGQHAAVLTDDGAIYTWGRGGFGRLGHGDRDLSDKPRRIQALEGIPCVQVACGFAYTAAVTASGELYTWGAGENGRLGLGDQEDRYTPSRVEGLHSKVKEVYAGSVHSCVLTREGTVYSFGKHEYTGHGDVCDVLEPRLIPAFSGGSEAIVRQISVGPGGYHTMALTCQGEVYAWGHNRVAQLGIGNSFTVPRNKEGAHFLPSPQLVESLLGMNIVKVVAGWGHSAALTKSGQLYVCGRNYQGQLGLGNPQHFPQNERGHPFQADFCLIERLSHLKITQIACGGEHSVAVAQNGEVWSFGAGQKGQLGHKTTNREDFPRVVERLKSTRRDILHVACGNNCTLVLAGGEAFPTLCERAAAVIRGNLSLWADVESLGLLPPSMVDCLNVRPEGGAGGRIVRSGVA